MSISELKKDALRALDNNWGKAVLVMLLVLLSGAVSTFVEVIFSGGLSEWWEATQSDETSLNVVLANLLVSFALIPFTIGCYWYFLNVLRGENPGVSNVFTPYKNGQVIAKLIGASIVQGIFIFLWSLLFIIPGIIKAFSYSQTFYILKDHPDMGILDAITESRKRMNGLKFKYFLMHLSFIGWAILAIFTFGIGMLFLTPYIYTTQAAFYQHLIADSTPTSEEESETETPLM